MALGVVFAGGKKDEKQYVTFALWNLTLDRFLISWQTSVNSSGEPDMFILWTTD